MEGERQLGHRLDAVPQRRRRLLQPLPVRPLPEARRGFEGGEVDHPAAVFGLRCWRLAAEYDTVKKESGAPIMEESRQRSGERSPTWLMSEWLTAGRVRRAPL